MQYARPADLHRNPLEPPVWTADTRSEHDREDLRYPSDLTDAEWAILESLFPSPAKTGRKRG